MLRDLIKVANRLNSLGLSKEADFIDRVIKKQSMMHGDNYLKCDYMDEDIGMTCGRLYGEHRNVRSKGRDLCPDCAEKIKSEIPHHIRDSDLDDLG